jgi:hypothetical protein
MKRRDTISQLFGVAVTLLCFFPYTCGWRGAVKPDLADSPRAPVIVYLVTTPIIPKGHMRSCPGRAASRFSATPRDRDPGFPDVDWGTQ